MKSQIQLMKSRTLLILFAFSLLAGTCKKNDSGRRHLIVESSFEGNNPLSGWENAQHCCDYSVTEIEGKATDGTHSLRLEVRATDAITSGSIRSEITQPVEGVGVERWYGFNMFLENWTNDNAGEHVFQWHPDNSRGVATAALWTSGGRFMLQTDPSGSNTASTYTDIGPIISNQWISWVIHVRWADDNSGIFQVWENGSLVVDRHNLKTAPPEGTYFKLGINKFGWGIQTSSTTERILYFDEVRIGDENASYEDVKPGK
jgi:hypothetical protein